MIRCIDTLPEEDIKRLLHGQGNKIETVVPLTYQEACDLMGKHQATKRVFDRPHPGVYVREPFRTLDYGDDKEADEIEYKYGGGMFVSTRTLHAENSGIAGVTAWRPPDEMNEHWCRLVVTIGADAVLAKPFEHDTAMTLLRLMWAKRELGDIGDEWARRFGRREWGLFCTLYRDDMRTARPVVTAALQETYAHELKTWPQYFQAVLDGIKPFEVRSTRDRRFLPGQLILLREWAPNTGDYTGRTVAVRVTYVLHGNDGVAFGIGPDVAVFAFKKIEVRNA